MTATGWTKVIAVEGSEVIAREGQVVMVLNKTVDVMELQTVNFLCCGSVTVTLYTVCGMFWVHSYSRDETVLWHDLLQSSSQLQVLEE